MKRLFKATAALLVVGYLIAASASAAYPEQAVNYIIPFAPGGESDIAARLQEPYFKSHTGQSIVVQYRAGAGGAAAWSQLNKLAADGYQIVGINLPHIVLQPLTQKAGYKTEDITPIYWFHYTPDALLVAQESPYKTLAEFVVAAQKTPSALTVGGTGSQSGNELAKMRFDHLADIKTTYIPFKGTGAVNVALLGQQISASWGYTTVQIQLGDQVRCLAVAMETRHPRLPDCPTFKELGYDMIGGVYRGLAVPKDTPLEIQNYLAELFKTINQDQTFIDKMVDNGFSLIDIGLEEMPDFMQTQQENYIQTLSVIK